MSPGPIIATEAVIPNPALKPLDFLIGDWRTTGTHPLAPGEILTGRASFAWHEGGAFLIMRAEVHEPRFPSGLAIIASDAAAHTFAMSYFDQRGVSRLYRVTVGDRTVAWRRDDPEFSQTTVITAGEGGDTLISKGRMSRNRGPWTDDLSQIFERDRPA